MSRTNPNGTYRGAFGPNARGALAVWRSKDYGQTFQWSSFFDPTDYFTGSCAYPQYRNPSQTANGYLGIPWDMGGSDGHAEMSLTVPWSGDTPIAPACRQNAAANQPGSASGNNPGKAPPNTMIKVQLTKAARLVPGGLIDGSKIKFDVPRPDVKEHLR